ncbi:ester cyclase [Nocardia sp. XZ_19_369]|uniref:ester cyclase n=1 Tax=Nocardia sp. XZ_19_369 TaxID=2769487 RepID=UPI0027D34333|nr:ester cyclase [Nocardia sp. XZ_19_369]
MEQNTRTTTIDDPPTYRDLLAGWMSLWNGDYALAHQIVAPDFRLHAALLGGGDGSAVHGPESLVDWIAQTRAAFTELVFSVEVGPIVERDHLALRWVAVGTYHAGFPGATAPSGTAVRFTGTDILRLTQDRIAEYWVNSDMHVLLATLGVRP